MKDMGLVHFVDGGTFLVCGLQVYLIILFISFSPLTVGVFSNREVI